MSLCENVTSLCSEHYSLIVLKMLFKRQLAEKERDLFLSSMCRSAAVTANKRSPVVFFFFGILLYSLFSSVHYCVDLAKLQGIWWRSFI